MNISDRKQLVSESSGSIEDHQQHTNYRNKMGSRAKLVWIAIVFCLGLIALAHCIPVEVIYTGEGCDCPTKLDFAVNVPSVPKPKKYQPSEYGYKIEIPKPREAKAKVSYSFDFEVEEPRPPKPVKQAKANLYAMIDRVAIKKGDCEDSYAAPPSTCSCGRSAAVSEPLYRYVFNHMAPPLPISLPPRCNCQRQNCICNLGRKAAQTAQYTPNAIFIGPTMRDYMLPSAELVPLEYNAREEESNDAYNNNGGGGDGDGDDAEVQTVNVRRKRDLQHTFLRPRRKLANRKRPSRFVKLYRKNLADAPMIPQRLFDLESLINKQHQRHHHQQQQQQSQPLMRKMKRRTKKTPYAQQRSRLVKREIKGEYDLLEKEREQMDLTLPEIIQFMPETLQPNFKRGQCYYGCGDGTTQNPTRATKTSEHKRSGSAKNFAASNEYNMSSRENDSEKPSSAYITYTDNDTQTKTATDNMHNETDIDVNETDIDVNETDIDVNETDIDVNETDMDPNVTDMDANVTDMDANVTDTDANETDLDASDTTSNTKHDTESDNSTIESLNLHMETDAEKAATSATSNEKKLRKETPSTKNDVSSTFTKRHATNYHTVSSSSSSADGVSAKCSTRAKKSSSTLKSTKKRAYNAHSTAAPPISTNPNYKPQQLSNNAPSARPYTTDASTKISTCEMNGKWNVENNNRYSKQALTSKTPIARASHDHHRYHEDNDDDSVPLHYARELDSPIGVIRPHDFVTPLHDHKYSIQFIDVKHLDKIIADIVYSHPEFLYATAHLGGALVDPESWQEKEAVDYAKQLVDDRLSLLFGKENDFTIQHHIPSVPIPLYGLLPPLF